MKRILSRSLQRTSGLSPDLQIARVFEIFRMVMVAFWQEDRASFLTPVSFREGILKVETRAPSAKQQFQVDLLRIKNEINRQIGKQIVVNIVIQSKGF